MKTIGMIGGMSWESTAEYYRLLNEEVKAKWGGHHSAKCLLYSVDFHDIKQLQHQEEWEKLTNVMIEAALKVEKAGADFLVICTNTMHLMAESVAERINIPLLHIADSTAEHIKVAGFQKVGLLATMFTMEKDFYKGRLQEKHGLEVIVPDAPDRQVIHDIIYNELCLGQVHADSKVKYLHIIEKLVDDGAECIILGCTEITLLIQQEDVSVPVFDTTKIHAQSAVEHAL